VLYITVKSEFVTTSFVNGNVTLDVQPPASLYCTISAGQLIEEVPCAIAETDWTHRKSIARKLIHPFFRRGEGGKEELNKVDFIMKSSKIEAD